MRLTEKNELFCNIPESGCNLHYTPKENMGIDVNANDIDFVEGFINKLGQLEDIEDFVKSKTFYGKTQFGIVKLTFDKLDLREGENMLLIQFVCDKGCVFYNITDYGKTWALTKEELL